MSSYDGVEKIMFPFGEGEGKRDGGRKLPYLFGNQSSEKK
jgi:hypothetical protein